MFYSEEVVVVVVSRTYPSLTCVLLLLGKCFIAREREREREDKCRWQELHKL